MEWLISLIKRDQQFFEEDVGVKDKIYEVVKRGVKAMHPR